MRKKGEKPIDCIDPCSWKQPSGGSPRTGLLQSGNGGNDFLVVSFVASFVVSLLMLSLRELSFAMLSLDADFFDFFDFFVEVFFSLDMSLLLEASEGAACFMLSDLASVLGGVEGAGAGAGVCAAALRETAKAPASSADINLFMNSSSVSLFEGLTPIPCHAH